MITEAIDALVVVEEGADPGLADAAFPPDGGVAPVAVAEGLAAGERAIAEQPADLMIVVCRGAGDGVVDLIRRSRGERPDRPIVALAADASDLLVRSIFDAGADDMIKLPETPERVRFTLEKAIARHRGREATAREGDKPMICMLGPKGGTGKTVTSSNLIVDLARAGQRSVGVDLDLQFGDMGLALGLRPEPTIYDLATSGGTLDAEKLDAYLATHESGARALLAPIRPDHAAAVSSELLRDVFSLLRSTHDVVVVDTPPDFTPEVITAVDASSHVCMVGNMDALSLKNTKLGLETLDLMDYDPTRITLVLNRADSDVGLSRTDVETVVGRSADVLIPSDRAVPRSLNEGVPIVVGRERSPVAGALRQLTSIYLPAEARSNGNRLRGSRRRTLLRRSR
jgi:pilus assembly protein CpaE